MEDGFLNKVFQLETNFHSWTVSEEFLLVCIVPVGLFLWGKFRKS